VTVKIETVYTARATEARIANRAVAIHCSDHRFQDAFREFLSEGLGLVAYTPLAIPGGGHFSSSEEVMPKLAKVGFQSVAFLLKRTGAKRIILIGHADCLFFKDQLQFFFLEQGASQKQFASLRKGRRVMRERFAEPAIEAYFADADAEGRVEFLKIE
jgi:hypothetical protein